MTAKTASKVSIIVGGALLAILAGCASKPETPVQQPHIAPHIPEPAPIQIPQTPAPAAALKPMSDDQCGAQALQYLVGKPRTDIPVPLEPSTRRVVCSTCVVTQEYRADRQTITFSSDTGLITSVKCG